MVNKRPIRTIRLPGVAQKTDSHCGPAVIQLLFSHVDKTFNQDEIVEAAGATKSILQEGTRPRQLAKAVSALAPGYQYWFKQNATIEDLITLLHTYQYPVGINWQGLFYDTPEQERPSKDDDRGHYSVVVGINTQKDTITIADTYREYSKKPRTFSLKWFLRRWNDNVVDIDKKIGEKSYTATNNFIFIIAPKRATFPKKLGMQLPSQLYRLTIKRKLNMFEKFFYSRS